MTKPHIPLSEIRKLWGYAKTCADLDIGTRDVFVWLYERDMALERLRIAQAEIKALRAQLAECQQAATALAMLTEDGWEDVPDGVYGGGDITLTTPQDCRQAIVHYSIDSRGKVKILTWIPDNWRIQRRKEGSNNG